MASERCSDAHHLSSYSQSDSQLMIYAKKHQNQNQPVFPEINDICKMVECYDCYLTIELTVKLTPRRLRYHNTAVLYSSVLSRAEVSSERKQSQSQKKTTTRK